MRPSRSQAVYAERINLVIDHISAHLDEPLDLRRLARLAHFSPYHFHRLFRMLVGEPLNAFTRRLRLERAVYLLKHGPRASLTDIALRCGFASSSDFSRTFKQVYGFSPRQYTPERFEQDSKIWQDLRVNQGYGFIGWGHTGNPDRFRVKQVERPEQHLAYLRVIGVEDPDRLVAGYQGLMSWGRRRGLVPGATVIGMSQDDPDITPAAKYRYDFCLVVPRRFRPDGEIGCQTLPAGRYAVLHCQGDIHKVDRAWNYLFQVWLPRSGFQPVHQPALEVFRKTPEQIGWEQFDLDCHVAIQPLGTR